ncbi:hypothetical protein LCGC14_2214710, partial [marine sediment metagenome]
MRKSVFFILLLLATIQVSAYTDIQEGDISGIWTKSGSPYRILGDVTVPYNDTLVIKPGVIVDFEGHHKFTIRGVLTAVGAIGDTIRFTRRSNDGLMSPDTVGLADTSNQDGSWDGIVWSTYGNPISGMSHCIIEFINTVDNSLTVWSDHRAPVWLQTSFGNYLKNSIIRNNYGAKGGGILTYDGNIIDSCLITNNRVYQILGVNLRPAGGILVYYSNSVEVTNCVITNNISTGWYAAGGISIQTGSPLIKNNVISNNKSNGFADAGGIECHLANPKIIQNLIVNNEGTNNGGIHFNGGGGKLYNNTICNNKCASGYSGGMSFEGAPGTLVYNNIIYGNENSGPDFQIELESISTKPVVKYNLIGDSIQAIKAVDSGTINESDNFFGNP